jgi:hypothetical protein
MDLGSWGGRRGSLRSGSGRGAQSFFHLLAHGRGGFQFRTGLEQVLSQFIALAHQRLELPTQLFRVVFMRFGRAFCVLAGAVDLKQPMALARGVALLELDTFAVVGGGSGIKLGGQIGTLSLLAVDPRPQASALRIALLHALLQRLCALVGSGHLLTGEGKALLQRAGSGCCRLFALHELPPAFLQRLLALGDRLFAREEGFLQCAARTVQRLIPQVLQRLGHGFRELRKFVPGHIA